MSTGKLIVIEGLDGCGKTTQIKNIIKYLTDCGYTPKEVSNVHDSILGRTIRSYLLDKGLYASAPQAGCLFLASLFSVDKDITPHLAKTGPVVCSRHYPSTLVYAGINNDVCDAIHIMAKLFVNQPDIIVYLRLTPEDAARRVDTRGLEKEIFERADNQRKYFDRYESLLTMPSKYINSTIITIDASKSLAVVTDELISKLQNVLSIDKL